MEKLNVSVFQSHQFFLLKSLIDKRSTQVKKASQQKSSSITLPWE